MRELSISLIAVALALGILGIYLYTPSQTQVAVERPNFSTPGRVEVYEEKEPLELGQAKRWTSGEAREFTFNCSPGSKATFTLVTTREGSEAQITASGMATPENTRASIPAKCYFGESFECTFILFRERELKVRLKNLALSAVEVNDFTMTGSSGIKCDAK